MTASTLPPASVRVVAVTPSGTFTPFTDTPSGTAKRAVIGKPPITLRTAVQDPSAHVWPFSSTAPCVTWRSELRNCTRPWSGWSATRRTLRGGTCISSRPVRRPCQVSVQNSQARNALSSGSPSSFQSTPISAGSSVQLKSATTCHAPNGRFTERSHTGRWPNFG